MSLAACAIARRLDAAQNYRPWFLLRGRAGIPVTPEHASWDLGDMTGRYLEGLILARRMGVTASELSLAEGRLQRYLLKLLGSDGLVHDPASGAVDHPFSQGSTLYGLVTWFEDSSDPTVRLAAERLISGLLRASVRQGGQLIQPAAKLEKSSGSHLAGYQIYPAIRFYELTGYSDALVLAEGLTRWALADPTLGPDGAITLPLSWEGHIHSWLDTLAGCARTARHASQLDRAHTVARCRATYDWVRRSNATSFGWIATFPTHGSSETCAISSALRLALELAAAGHAEYFNDVERFVRNQVVEAQFRNLAAYTNGTNRATPLLQGCFDSQSLPNGHLGTRGGEDVGTVEGCCLSGGMRALALAWNATQSFDERGVTVHLALSQNGPAAEVIGYQPFAGRVDVVPHAPGDVRVRVPDWADKETVRVSSNGTRVEGWTWERDYVVVRQASPRARISVEYPLRECEELVTAGTEKYQARWRGDVVVEMKPPGPREPTYQGRLPQKGSRHGQAEKAKGNARFQPPGNAAIQQVPDTYDLYDAARLAAMSMLARLDLERGGQPFFRIYPFATPPRAEHEKWDDGDMSGRYAEALLRVRRMTGLPLEARETRLRAYLASLFDPTDGLCYTRGTDWTPRRACLFSQSTAMLGLLEWHRATGSPEARRLLDRHADGLKRLAVDRDDHAFFPKYEFDGQQFVDEPRSRNAPAWYGGRLILPLVEYWKLTRREDIRQFIEKLIRYTIDVSGDIKADGEIVAGEGWWGHLHSNMDMASGIAEFGHLAQRPGWVAWARRMYDWIGRTHTTRYGWVADVSGGRISESCAIASRIRLGLVLYRAGALEDPFGEIDRFVRNQLLESQFVNLGFLPPLAEKTPRTGKVAYAGIDRMIRGTFQCWGTANDLFGHDDIEGCGAGGGPQGLSLAWESQSEWRATEEGPELRVHLLFNRRIRGPEETPLTSGGAVAGELWSWLPSEGRVRFVAHREIPRLTLRLPDGSDAARASVKTDRGRGDRVGTAGLPAGFVSASSNASRNARGPSAGAYLTITNVQMGETIEVSFPLLEYETLEKAAGVSYRVQWRGNSVVALDPPGRKIPLYASRRQKLAEPVRMGAPRYP